MLTVTFDELEAALSASHAPLPAGEVHGSLCGALAANDTLDSADWLQEILPEGGSGDDELGPRNLLETLFNETAAALAGTDMEFAPLLPDDERPLEQRVAALAAWCSGFLSGLGSSGSLPPVEALPPAVGELLRDLTEINRAVPDTDEPEESSEASYAELVEYLRAGAQLVFEELTSHRQRPRPP
jgi:yecA family protein